MKIKPYLTYLAGPYTAIPGATQFPEQLKELRYELLTRAAAYLMTNVWLNSNVFSPITHSHPLHVIAKMEGDWRTWARIDKQYIRLSKRLVVLTLWGWKESVGVQAEIRFAKKCKIPVYYMNPNDYTLSKNEPR